MTKSTESSRAVIILIAKPNAVFLLGENFINLVISNDVSKLSLQSLRTSCNHQQPDLTHGHSNANGTAG